MSNIIDINNYTPLKSDKFFFDANIWMYLFCPLGNYQKEQIEKYDSFLKKALQAKSSIFVCSLILSEFFNSYTHLEFNILKEKHSSEYKNFKKDFKPTEIYKKLVNQIVTIVKTKILKLSERVDDGFENMNLDDLFSNIEVSDFNDNYYFIMAAAKKFTIVTNDYDFISSKKAVVPVLTANYKLLRMG